MHSMQENSKLEARDNSESQIHPNGTLQRIAIDSGKINIVKIGGKTLLQLFPLGY